MRRSWMVGVLLVLLAGCSVPDDEVAVPVSAINYTERELGSFLFIHPETKTPAGGPGLAPYEAGGTMCCYRLPKQWRPGIKVRLRYYWYEGSLQAPRTEREFELPRYAGGRVGMLWAVFYGGDDVEVVVSDVDPGHMDWPGRLKHWPQPSLAYKRKLWQQEMDELKARLSKFESAAQGAPAEELQEAWAFYQKWEPDSVRGFSGPDDPAFAEWRKNSFAEAAEQTRQRIRQLEEKRP
ncbi:MAG: DUF3304 domain-containing protein [Tepidiforma sp.]